MRVKSATTKPHVALLRGINVGGKNQLPMSALVELFSANQCSQVQTYIQSGNVVFHCTATVAAGIGALVSQRIEKRFGYQLPVIVRSGQELDQILQANPFLGKAGIGEAALHVMFLADQPAPSALAGLDPNRSPPDAPRAFAAARSTSIVPTGSAARSSPTAISTPGWPPTAPAATGAPPWHCAISPEPEGLGRATVIWTRQRLTSSRAT